MGIPRGMTNAEIESLLYEDHADDYDSEPEAAEHEEQVTYHIRRAKTIAAEAEQVDQLFIDEIDKLKARRKSTAEGYANKHKWHASSVEQWHRAQLAAKSVGKTVKTPHGSSELRGNPTVMQVTDEEKLRTWLAGAGLESKVYPVVEPSLSKAALNDALTIAKTKNDEPGTVVAVINPDTGETVPGVVAIKAGDRHQGLGKIKGA